MPTPPSAHFGVPAGVGSGVGRGTDRGNPEGAGVEAGVGSGVTPTPTPASFAFFAFGVVQGPFFGKKGFGVLGES